MNPMIRYLARRAAIKLPFVAIGAFCAWQVWSIVYAAFAEPSVGAAIVAFLSAGIVGSIAYNLAGVVVALLLLAGLKLTHNLQQRWRMRRLLKQVSVVDIADYVRIGELVSGTTEQECQYINRSVPQIASTTSIRIASYRNFDGVKKAVFCLLGPDNTLDYIKYVHRNDVTAFVKWFEDHPAPVVQPKPQPYEPFALRPPTSRRRATGR